MSRRLFLPLLSLALTLGLSGCWNSVELNQFAIISGTGVGYKDNQYEISYQIVIPQAISSSSGTGGSSVSPINVFSSLGSTPIEAVQRASLEFPRTLFFAHNRVVVVSEQAARQGLTNIIDLYLRNQENRETVSIFITRDNPKNVLKVLLPLEKIQGSGVLKMTTVAEEQTSRVRRTRVYAAAMTIASRSASAVIPEIVITGGIPAQQTTGAWDKSSSSATLKFGTNAVFRYDKLVGWLNAQESIGVNLVKNEMKSTTLTFACPRDSNSLYSIRVSDVKSQLHTARQGDRAVVTADAQLKVVLIEADCNGQLASPEQLKQAQRSIEKAITGYMEEAWQASVRLKSDILGISDLIYRKQHGIWRSWENEKELPWTQVDFRPTASVTIERTGMSNDSFRTLLGK
ncbi:spore germination protein KC [Paenibacillus sp. UNCCL117]|uniref:Ger(x)C family spore germination protein n=1 Tax=unclassified Paenibacillus TaxID=185978 RepID=UPI00088ABC07|nr:MULTISPECIES: Ger(x)C family spore germination protein [unclassified Paenibacillus]SDC14747.1 spore germination protein KC [Paenibacillus sp. cl123]SFW17372.1 spore germination protein KC [Paenibacillus sp. UNCCL117]